MSATGGMQQRVVNAMALVGEPELVIADEPTSGLDAELVDATAAQLERIAARGAAVLVITHDLGLAERLGGRLVLLYASHVVELRRTADFSSASRPAPHDGQSFIGSPAARGARAAFSMLLADAVDKRFRTPAGVLTALDGVSLAVEPGSRVGLAGRSGSGKSTLARVLALLLASDAGTVSVDGEQVRQYGLRTPRGLRRRVQLLWQSPRTAADPRLRLRDLVLEPLLSGGGERPDPSARTAALERWVPRVGLTGELLDRFPHEVSDGQLQRACLARALVVEPRYLVCDEPTSMPDVSTQAALLRAIADVQRETGLGVLPPMTSRSRATGASA